MNRLYFLLVIVLLGCKPQQTNTEEIIKSESLKTEVTVNDCINERIQLFNKTLQCKRGAKVSAYLFQEKLVYVFKEGPCTADMHAPVFDQNCNEIGLLGGFLGNTLINEVDFGEAVFQKDVWIQAIKK